MRDEDPAIIDQAIDWHLRRADMGAEDWHAFIAWLELSPANADAYDRIAMRDQLLPRPEAAPLAANDDRPWRRRWPLFAGGAFAAAIAAALLVPLARAPSSMPYVVQTEPGQRRNVQLADGTRIELSGGSRLRLDRADPRTATLETGEALFAVLHDAAHPFVLHSGSIAVRDLGTTFNVARAGPRFDVQLSSGSVLLNAPGREITLVPGDALTVREDRRQIGRARVPIDSVGAWRGGTLRFGGDPLPEVVAAIRRLYGTDVKLEGDLPGRGFTGIIQLSGAADRDIPHLAALIGAGWRRNGEQWILAPRPGASR